MKNISKLFVNSLTALRKDFAARHGVSVKKGNERILAKINSSNRQERNESINFLAKGTEWMDGSVYFTANFLVV